MNFLKITNSQVETKKSFAESFMGKLKDLI